MTKLVAPGPKVDRQDAGLAGEAAVRGGHEARGLLVAVENQLDLFGAAQRFEQVEVFLARDAEEKFHALVLQGADEEIGRFH